MGRGACWCVTFFSLCGVLVVKAIQNSPCWRKMRRKWVFRACLESFVPVGLAEAASRESFVPTPAPRAVQSSPCSVCWCGCEREKVLPAHEKCPKNGGLWRAGRVFSRKCRWRGRAGRVFSRKCRWRPRAGRTFSRVIPRRPRVGRIFLRCGGCGRSSRPPPPGVSVGIRLGDPRGPGAWRARRRPASRRSGTPVPPTRRPSRSSGMRARSHGR